MIGFSILLGTIMFVVGLAIFFVELTFSWQRELRGIADGQEFILADTLATRPPVIMMFRDDGSVFLRSNFVEHFFLYK